MLGRPRADGDRAALEHGDVERVDLRLQDHDGALRGGRSGEDAIGREDRRVRLQDQPLQGPAAALDHLRRDARQRDDRAHVPARLPGVLERRDVVLDTVVVRGERRGAGQADGAVGRQEGAARERAPGGNEYEGGGDAGDHETADGTCSGHCLSPSFEDRRSTASGAAMVPAARRSMPGIGGVVTSAGGGEPLAGAEGLAMLGPPNIDTAPAEDLPALPVPEDRRALIDPDEPGPVRDP